MPFVRVFLDWSKPALPAAADYLISARDAGTTVDLSQIIAVLPGRRAGRRLLELLLERTEGRLIPPRAITESELPELLYESKRPFASSLVQRLAWAEAARSIPRPMAEHVVRDPPADSDVDGWKALGELLWGLHRELAAELRNFSDVLRVGSDVDGFAEQRRWKALKIAQDRYLALLDDLGLWDVQTARIVAERDRECRTDRDIVLIGTVDLNESTRRMLDQVADRVTALIHAPEAFSERFDSHGCLRPAQWTAATIGLERKQIRVVDKPQDQADEVVRVLAGFEGKYRADEITIGLADESLMPRVQRRVKQYGASARWAVGKPLPHTAVVQLLEALADYLETDQSQEFAALVRHPLLFRWLCQQRISHTWLKELDYYLSKHLPQKLGEWLEGTTSEAQIKRAHRHVEGLLKPFQGTRRPLNLWPERILSLLQAVVEPKEGKASVPMEKTELDALALVIDTLDSIEEIPETLLPVVSGAQALRILLEELDQLQTPPQPDEDAIEMVGRLELPLDDAPAAVVTTFNEGFFPSSSGGDLFLPNRLRQRLGIQDHDRRLARDVYALSAMLASREETVLIAGRKDDRGDPLLPSRLMFACDECEAAERVRLFFSAATSAPLAPFGPDFKRPSSSHFVVPRPAPPVGPIDRVGVTAFRDYLQCPYRFYLGHILKLCCMSDDADELEGGAFGDLIHTVLKSFGQSEVKDSTSADEIGAYLHAALDAASTKLFGRLRWPAVNVQIEQARRRLEAFARWQADWAREGWTIHSVETSPQGGVITFPLNDGRSIKISGRIDRIDWCARSNAWALLDYKTSDRIEKGKPVGPEQTHRRQESWVDLQLPLYRHFASAMGVTGDMCLGYIVLPGDTAKTGIVQADWSEDDFEDADRTIRETAQRILDGLFWPPASDPPEFDGFAVICQEAVFDRRLAE